MICFVLTYDIVMSDHDYLFKIMLIGDSGVGKSSLLSKYVRDEFDKSYISTIGVDFRIKTVKHKNKIVKLQIWDTAGQERFRTITASYYRGAHGIVVAFDLTNKESFENISSWLNEIDINSSGNNISLIIVGTKADLVSKRTVSQEVIKKFVSENKCIYVETSSLTGQNVEKAFDEMVANLINSREGSLSEKKLKTSIELRPVKSIKKEGKNFCCYF